MENISLEEELQQLTAQQKEVLQKDLNLSEKAFKKLKKKFHQLSDRDDKAFMDMLTLVNKNHYTLNQMIDRKARILLSVNIVVLSLIIGRVISNPSDINGWKFLILGVLGTFSFFSIIYTMLAVLPEKFHGKLDGDSIKKKEGNPLFYGNFIHMPEKLYEDTIMEMVHDRDFIYRSLIQDIYHLGQVLQDKRKHLRTSLFIFVIGLCFTLLLTFFLRYMVVGV